MRAEQNKFKASPVAATASAASNPIASGYRSTSRPTTIRYYETRDRYYRDSGWQPPVYVYQSSSSFGAWDALLLWSILDRNDGRFAYHHASDPGYIAWRREADRLAQDNAELKAKLAKLDESAKAQQGPKDPKFLPDGVKPEIALAATVVTGQQIPELTFATGPSGTTYNALCAGNQDGLKGFKANAENAMKVTCAETGGSKENVLGFISGKYQAILAQADAIDWAMRANKGKKFGRAQLTAYRETMWVLVHKDSGIKSISDLKPGVHTLYVGPSGAGGEVSFQNLAAHAKKSRWLIFSKHNAQYEGVNIKNAPYADAVKTVTSDKNAAMMVLMGGYSPFMQKVNAEHGDKVRLIPFNGDKSFTRVKDRDGNTVYQECTIPGAQYPKLLAGKTSVKTLCVQAVVVVAESWVQKSGQAAEDVFLTAWSFTKPDVTRINGGVE